MGAASTSAAATSSNPTTATASINNVSDLTQPSITSSVSATVINSDDGGGRASTEKISSQTTSTAIVGAVLTAKPLPKSASTSVSSLACTSGETTLTSSPSQQSLRPSIVEEESQ